MAIVAAILDGDIPSCDTLVTYQRKCGSATRVVLQLSRGNERFTASSFVLNFVHCDLEQMVK
jgi:hypothetical protein